MLKAYLGLDIYKRPDIYKHKINTIKKQYNIYYSAAHLEEILNTTYANTNEKISVLKKIMASITSITDNKIILSGEDSLEFALKPPDTMLNRIAGKGGENLDLDEIVKISEKRLREKTDDLKADIRKIHHDTSKLSPDEILKNEHFREFVKITIPYDLFFIIETQPKQYVRQLIYENKNLRDTMFEIVFKALDVVNYYYNPTDVCEASHAMYAASVDTYVTDDIKFIKRCFVVYKYLGMTTKLTYFKQGIL